MWIDWDSINAFLLESRGMDEMNSKDPFLVLRLTFLVRKFLSVSTTIRINSSWRQKWNFFFWSYLQSSLWNTITESLLRVLPTILSKLSFLNWKNPNYFSPVFQFISFITSYLFVSWSLTLVPSQTSLCKYLKDVAGRESSRAGSADPLLYFLPPTLNMMQRGRPGVSNTYPSKMLFRIHLGGQP